MAKKKHEAGRPGDASARIGVGLWELWKRRAAPPDYSTMATAVLLSAGKMTRQDFLGKLLEMELRFPGRGWLEHMNELEAFYVKHGLALDEFPKSMELFEKGFTYER